MTRRSLNSNNIAYFKPQVIDISEKTFPGVFKTYLYNLVVAGTSGNPATIAWTLLFTTIEVIGTIITDTIALIKTLLEQMIVLIPLIVPLLTVAVVPLVVPALVGGLAGLTGLAGAGAPPLVACNPPPGAVPR